jgi:hypothetical protein
VEEGDDDDDGNEDGSGNTDDRGKTEPTVTPNWLSLSIIKLIGGS